MRNKGCATNQGELEKRKNIPRRVKTITLVSCEMKGSPEVSGRVVITGNWDWIGENCITKRTSKNSKYEENLNYMANKNACESKW